MKKSSDRVIARDRVIGSGGIQCVRDIYWIVIAMLREIFDEAAYDRFLLRTNARRSVESYRMFVKEREAGIARRPRCC
jgi:hypothetical protein